MKPNSAESHTDTNLPGQQVLTPAERVKRDTAHGVGPVDPELLRKNTALLESKFEEKLPLRKKKEGGNNEEIH